ncbi:MAG: hypothetical protein JK586_14560 [Nocardiopsis sp. BM-2018]|nr:MAG: hypothetical protein JK586_14560 [Nocardiopsis sp. BM-2018]
MTLVYILMAFVVARVAVTGVVPLARQRPWLVDGRAEAGVLAGLFIAGAVLSLAGSGSAAHAQAQVLPPSSLIWWLAIGALVVVATAMRGSTVYGVRDEDFRSALADALRDGGYEHDVRVDAGGHPSTVVLRGRWHGVEVAAWSRHGYGTVRGKGASGRVVVGDLVARMRAAFDDGQARPHTASSVMEIALGCVLAVMFVVTLR